jgi:hypothetical protein
VPRNGPAGRSAGGAARAGLIDNSAVKARRSASGGKGGAQSARRPLAEDARPRSDHLCRPIAWTPALRIEEIDQPPSRPAIPSFWQNELFAPAQPKSRSGVSTPQEADPGPGRSETEERARFQEAGSAPSPLGTLTKPRSH